MSAAASTGITPLGRRHECGAGMVAENWDVAQTVTVAWSLDGDALARPMSDANGNPTGQFGLVEGSRAATLGPPALFVDAVASSEDASFGEWQWGGGRRGLGGRRGGDAGDGVGGALWDDVAMGRRKEHLLTPSRPQLGWHREDGPACRDRRWRRVFRGAQGRAASPGRHEGQPHRGDVDALLGVRSHGGVAVCKDALRRL